MSNGENMTPTVTKSAKGGHAAAAAATAVHDVAKGETETQKNPLGTKSLSIGDLIVTVPVKFGPGHVLTEAQARILDAAYQRQFINNQNTSAENRARKLAKAKTAAERAAFRPLTPDELVEIYLAYEPNVGNAPRQSSVERMRHEATWRAIIAYLTEHNKAVEAGQPGIIAAAGGKGVAIPKVPTKTKGVTEEQHKANLEAFEAIKTTQIERFAANPKFAERIQIQLDALEAEKGSKKSEAAAVETVSVDALF
jgi:hypothetical protein